MWKCNVYLSFNTKIFKMKEISIPTNPLFISQMGFSYVSLLPTQVSKRVLHVKYLRGILFQDWDSRVMPCCDQTQLDCLVFRSIGWHAKRCLPWWCVGVVVVRTNFSKSLSAAAFYITCSVLLFVLFLTISKTNPMKKTLKIVLVTLSYSQQQSVLT